MALSSQSRYQSAERNCSTFCWGVVDIQSADFEHMLGLRLRIFFRTQIEVFSATQEFNMDEISRIEAAHDILDFFIIFDA